VRGAKFLRSDVVELEGSLLLLAGVVEVIGVEQS
jgi:hypothetical protein